MATTYNAGIVTAYGAAVRGGYTGTYDEFCEAQAHIATNADRAEEAADRAESAAETLSGSVAQIASNTQDITALKEDLVDLQNEVNGLDALVGTGVIE